MAMPGRAPGSGSMMAEIVSGSRSTAPAIFIALSNITVLKGHNPRGAHTLSDDFSAENLTELTESVRAKGVLTPIMVQRDEDTDGYLLIAGERRFRAAGYAGLKEIPACLVPLGLNRDELALIENGMREPLHPVDEAMAIYTYLANVIGCLPEQVPARILSVRTTGKDPLGLLAKLAGLIGARGRSLSTWGQHNAGILKMTEDELRAVRTRQLALKSALHLTRLQAQPEARAQLLQEAIEHTYSSEEMQARVQALLQGQVNTKTSATRSLVHALKRLPKLKPEHRSKVESLMAELQRELERQD